MECWPNAAVGRSASVPVPSGSPASFATECSPLSSDEVARGHRSTTMIENTRQTVSAWKKMNGLQEWRHASKLAGAWCDFASQHEPPVRLATTGATTSDLREEGQGIAAQAYAHRQSNLRHSATRRQPLNA